MGFLETVTCWGIVDIPVFPISSLRTATWKQRQSSVSMLRTKRPVAPSNGHLAYWKGGFIASNPLYELHLTRLLGINIFFALWLAQCYKLVFPFRITLACCVLHNIAQETNQPLEFDDGVDMNEDFEIQQLESTTERLGPVSREESRLRRIGFDKRLAVANNL